MASEYEFGINPFQDFLMESLMYEVDISNSEFVNEIKPSFRIILEDMLENPNEVLYLDFKILNEDGHYKVIGMNSVSALWLSGIIVDNAELIIKNSNFKLDNRKYKYDVNTNKLTYKIEDE
jgi:hypothetical protein